MTMGYLEDSIDWQDVDLVDKWLDGLVSQRYKDQPLAQDWARVSKIGEELGEAIQVLIGWTGQNPRKGETHDSDDLLRELADTAFTAIYAIQHFTKNDSETRRFLREHQEKMRKRKGTGKV